MGLVNIIFIVAIVVSVLVLVPLDLFWARKNPKIELTSAYLWMVNAVIISITGFILGHYIIVSFWVLIFIIDLVKALMLRKHLNA